MILFIIPALLKSAEIEDELKELKRERESADREIEELKKMLGED